MSCHNFQCYGVLLCAGGILIYTLINTIIPQLE